MKTWGLFLGMNENLGIVLGYASADSSRQSHEFLTETALPSVQTRSSFFSSQRHDLLRFIA